MDSIFIQPGSRGIKKCVIIVAHPDDETLWAGGTIMMHPSWSWSVVCLTRKSDENREPKFRQAMTRLHTEGVIGDLDDGPDQRPLSSEEVEDALLKLLPNTSFDLIVTHSPDGEYTRHLRHEEISRAVINLWISGKIMTKNLWLFAYEDEKGQSYPKAIKTATIYRPLSNKTWKEKQKIITNIYGFDSTSWEAHTTPKVEAFWQCKTTLEAKKWLVNENQLA